MAVDGNIKKRVTLAIYWATLDVIVDSSMKALVNVSLLVDGSIVVKVPDFSSRLGLVRGILFEVSVGLSDCTSTSHDLDIGLLVPLPSPSIGFHERATT